MNDNIDSVTPDCSENQPSPAIYIQINHHISTFVGNPISKNYPSWGEWKASLKAALKTWRTPPGPTGRVGPSYLSEWGGTEGGARSRGCSATNPRHLEKIYGDNTPLTTLMSQFYARNQHRHESIGQYSLCLEELLQRIIRHPSSLPDKDKTLRDRFIKGISDNSIKMELRREVRKDSEINFREIKDEALELEGAIRMDSAEDVITADLHQVGVTPASVQSETPNNVLAFQTMERPASYKHLRKEVVHETEHISIRRHQVMLQINNKRTRKIEKQGIEGIKRKPEQQNISNQNGENSTPCYQTNPLESFISADHLETINLTVALPHHANIPNTDASSQEATNEKSTTCHQTNSPTRAEMTAETNRSENDKTSSQRSVHHSVGQELNIKKIIRDGKEQGDLKKKAENNGGSVL
ncbi:hypothetical protein BSL78_12215 [Apostichopus japonicus]|uniref:Uncharacterized protein n=1 Tax=Stichopus japonicus TaxID=307972 RepID=A0A2G8KSI0_STIJA|nr:hypothetical protein BSL78_12215 [Apostichopus japonicus]